MGFTAVVGPIPKIPFSNYLSLRERAAAKCKLPFLLPCGGAAPLTTIFSPLSLLYKFQLKWPIYTQTSYTSSSFKLSRRMESDFIGVKARYSILLPSRKRPTSSMKVLLLANKPQTSSASLLPSLRAKFSSRASLIAVETEPTGVFVLNESNGMEPRKISGSNIGKNGRIVSGKVVNFNAKEVLKEYSGMLREFASRGSLNEGLAVHGHLIKSGEEPDSHLWVSLINFYAKCGRSVVARKVLDLMPEPDVVSWTALIAGYVSDGCGSDGVAAYCEMRKEGITSNEFALATALKACGMCLDVEFGKQVHVEAIKSSLLLDVFVGSALVDLYAKCGEMELADVVFCSMPEKNAVSWNALLNGYVHMGDGRKVLKLFCRMTEYDLKFSKFTLSTVLKACASPGSLREGKVLHSLVIRSGCELDEFLGCSLVDMYSKCGRAYDALKVFVGIKSPDVVAWSAMITCLDQQGKSREAAELFNSMRHNGIRPNQFSLASLISAATNIADLHFGRSIHACTCKYGYESENSVGNALITMYMKNGCVEDGTQVFETINNKDLFSWNAFLSGFHDIETCEHGPRIYYQILLEGLKPNLYTFVSILRSCSSLLDVSFGKQVHAHIIKNRIDNHFVGTALIDMYAKCGWLDHADVIFNRMIDHDLFTWTVIIAGYAQTDQVEKAVKYLRQMLREGVKPNEFTLASCLSGCSRMATLDNGQMLHSMVIKAGHYNDVYVASALVDMYGKCGCMEDSEMLFKGMVSRDTISWNTIICGYSQHGHGEKALKAFRMMIAEGNVPDGVTFIGVLSACSYLGLVEEGKSFFNLMSIVHGITPSIEHYACMVDILGRAGKFNEVEIFIDEMKLESNSLIWETVLGACKLHGNVDLGEKAAQKIFELEPEKDSAYVLLSNIFAAKGRWGDVRNIRSLMSSRGVKKEPGCSWVDINGQVHVFTSQDASHPKIRDIHGKLEELGKKLTSMGYVPKTENVLHDISNREKEDNLHHHSERLALAFSLISRKTAKTIRIFKNLRICGDCHDVMKLTSNVTNQEIVVRDIKRFHHFKRGTCSCQDYW